MKTPALLLLLAIGLLPASFVSAAALSPRAAGLLDASVRQGDALWDDRAGLLFSGAPGSAGPAHTVRGSAWYALGLLQRDRAGDRERAVHGLRAVAAMQYHMPGAAWDGTFRRADNDPVPPAGAVMWKQYDPNWREFIGTTFALALTQYGDRMSPAARAELENAIRCAVEGELAQKRLAPSYTNIALMHGFLWADAGVRLKRPDWIRGAEAWMESVYRAFAVHESFDEFNSPTYYGVDLYGLALLRRYGATPRLRELGATMEAALWRDIGRFYHAGLKNLCGPFDRTYGMDMTRYVSLVGLWVALNLPAEQAPLPPVSDHMAHGHDFFFVPCFTALGTEIPPAAREDLVRFSGERVLRRPIAQGNRVATAWLAPQVMIGAEATGLTRGVAAGAQFHPATIHWQAPDGRVASVALVQSPPLDATAAAGQLAITTAGNCVFHIVGTALAKGTLERDHWQLPGLTVQIETDAIGFEVERGKDEIDVTFHGLKRIVFHVATDLPSRSAR